MKVCILAGGKGSRLGSDLPKPLLPIGDKPLLWHVMQIYARAGLTDFRIALGHRGDEIRAALPASCPKDWRLELLDTGLDTNTGGRLRRIAGDLDERFCLTWADGLGDIDLDALRAYHHFAGGLATLTAVRPPARFGYLDLVGGHVRGFAEKECPVDLWINGAFFVLEPSVCRLIEGDDTSFERDVLPELSLRGQLKAFRHEGFWQCVDTPWEHARLEQLWQEGAPWLEERCASS